jgi:uncharacterized protein
MAEAFFRFYAELNDFLADPEQRQKTIAYGLNGPVAVKHVIEALGVPHTEIELILANDQPVDFSYLVQEGDRITLYPPFTRLDITSLPALRPPLPSPPRFILDSHLGRLATYLRLLGFDTLYRNDYDDEELAELSYQEQRILLTRDRRLLMRKLVVHGYCLRTKESRQQLEAVLRRYNLWSAIQPWQRCLRCNGRLLPVSKEAIIDRLEPKTKLYYDEFHQCQSCGQIYWQGSHYQRLQRFIAAIQEGA